MITAADVDAFERVGAVCLRGLLLQADVALLREGIDQNLEHPSPRAKVASHRDDPGCFIEDFCNWQDIPAYRQLIFESGLGRAAARLMRSKTARLYHDHMLTKEPGTRQRTPWHQDQPYYNIDGRQNCSFWIPVDPVSETSTLRFDIPRTVGWSLQPGDAVCFHMLTLHSSGGVEEDRRRRVFSCRFIGDDITHAPRRWRTSPEFPGLGTEFPAGASMDHPLFPIVWTS